MGDKKKSDPSKKSKQNTEKTSSKKEAPKTPPTEAWHTFLKEAQPPEIEKRFEKEVSKIITNYEDTLEDYCFLALVDKEGLITTFDVSRIYRALVENNSQKNKNVLLLLLSTGGNIEPAYQISKLCKFFSENRFVVTIPREAKSAATLLAIGADEIHMGLLAQLGPIDPQLYGLPALGVSQALESIAKLSQKHPGSSEMFATYLTKALRVEQIGYYERISESAEQYAHRLLSSKKKLLHKADEISKKLVREYKDHNFVIDLEEARNILGKDWIKNNTPEVEIGEEIYNLIEKINIFLRFYQSKYLLILGDFRSGMLVFDFPKK